MKRVLLSMSDVKLCGVLALSEPRLFSEGRNDDHNDIRFTYPDSQCVNLGHAVGSAFAKIEEGRLLIWVNDKLIG